MKDLKSKSDSQLVVLALKNQEKFEHLVERYEKKLSRYIRRITGLDTESIEDILQESFIKIYINLNDYDSDFSFSSWAYRITHNEAINYLRKNKKVITVALENDDEDTTNLIEVLKSEIDIEAEISQKDLVERIRKAISLLPDKYREVLILRYMEDLNYEEISDILRMPMGTVATTINRAKEKFKLIAEKMHLNS
ncbi:RNA polymerase sigma factor [Candidatus Peregrinibacteria bacterium]|nr:RNA polymerase sigma factor [Candidatus Peregrinibacteria bacterium]